MILATAGHVDHGKTTLVRALTGVDTDRLPEEKRRGMSIDLGFAYLDAGEGREPIGFVDVPGHQAFLRNALAGLAGADRALLVVAADDGPMPQTLEHLALLALLEIPLAAVVLTKVDRVTAQRVQDVAASLVQLMQADVPLFPVAAPRGEGVAPLLAHLAGLQRTLPPRAAGGQFRLAVDRAFSVTGAGLVVTGTVVAGRIEAGAPVQLLSSGATGKVRGLHAQQRPATACRAGQRAALNLSGAFPHPEAIARGDWLVAGEPPTPQRRLDALLRLPPGARDALKQGTAVHVHLAAAHVTGRLALLEGATLEPGAPALVQLVLDAPLGAAAGDRLIVRDAAAQRTLAGGRVLDVFPPARGRARPQRLAELRQLARADAQESLQGLLAACPGGVALEPFRRNRNMTRDEAAALFAALPGPRLATAHGPLAFAPEHWDALASAALEQVAAWHAREPASAGPPADRILPGAGLPRDTVLAIAAQLVRDEKLARRGMGVALPAHAPRLPPADEGLWRQVRPLLAEGGRRPPSVAEVAYALRMEIGRVDAMLGQAAQCGHALRVSARHYFLPAAVLELAHAAAGLAAEHAGGFTAAAYRDRCGIGRNLSIEVLEFFDHVKYTRRVGERHVLLAAPGEVFGGGGQG